MPRGRIRGERGGEPRKKEARVVAGERRRGEEREGDRQTAREREREEGDAAKSSRVRLKVLYRLLREGREQRGARR